MKIYKNIFNFFLQVIKMEKLKETIIPGLIAGGSSLLIYKFVFGGSLTGEYVEFMGKPTEVSYLLAGTVAASEVAGKFLTEFVTPHLPEYGSLKKYEDVIVPPALTGLATYGMLRTFVTSETNLMNAVVLGSGSSVIGGYFSKMI
jgi:hypothetical protein